MWSKIRNAISKIKISVTIPWDTLVSWLHKLADSWTIQTNSSDPNDVMLVPPSGSTASALHWHAPTVVTNPKEPECGGATPPGKPVKMCP